MRAKCITACQKDRKVLYEAGKVYEVNEELLQSGFFEKVEEDNKKKK